MTTGSLSIERVEQIFTSQVCAMDQFDWFKEFIVGVITSSLDSHIERLTQRIVSRNSPSLPRTSSFSRCQRGRPLQQRTPPVSSCEVQPRLLHLCTPSVLVHVPGTEMVAERLLVEPCGEQNWNVCEGRDNLFVMDQVQSFLTVCAHVLDVRVPSFFWCPLLSVFVLTCVFVGPLRQRGAACGLRWEQIRWQEETM